MTEENAMLTTRNPDRRRTTSTTVRGLAALLLSAMVGCAHSPDVTTEPVDPGYASVQEDAPERACAVDVSDDGELSSAQLLVELCDKGFFCCAIHELLLCLA